MSFGFNDAEGIDVMRDQNVIMHVTMLAPTVESKLIELVSHNVTKEAHLDVRMK